MKTLGERAYDLRLSEGWIWEEITAQLGLRYSKTFQVTRAAETHAEEHDLPWPLHRAVIRGKRAYDLYAAGGVTWVYVAKALGWRTIGIAHTRAQAYAREYGLPWPLPRARTRGNSAAYMARCMRVGGPAYSMALCGLPWRTICTDLAVRFGMAQRYARRYAEEQKLPWPPKRPPRPLTTVQERLAAPIYRKLAAGGGWHKNRASWKTLARDIPLRPLRPLHLSLLVKRYAEQEGLPWPPVVRLPQQIVYELKLEGLTWAQVHAKAGLFNHLPGTVRGARAWAENNNLPWPIGKVTHA